MVWERARRTTSGFRKLQTKKSIKIAPLPRRRHGGRVTIRRQDLSLGLPPQVQAAAVADALAGALAEGATPRRLWRCEWAQTARLAASLVAQVVSIGLPRACGSLPSLVVGERGAMEAMAFNYTHHVLCGATTVLSPTRAAAFAFYRDENVQPTTPRAGVPPGHRDTVYGASAYELEATPDGRVLVTDIFLTRQLADEEAFRKLGGRPHADYGPLLARLPLADAQEGSAPAHSAGRAARHAAAAASYNSAWSTGDAQPVLALLSADFHSFSMLTGRVAAGRDALTDAVAALHSRWQPHWHDAIVAPTPGNKAFTLWRAAGLATIDAGDGRPPFQTWATTWGLSLLLFDEAGAITAALAFAPPLPGGRAALMAREEEEGGEEGAKAE